MSCYEPAPTIFFRVQDEYSRARYDPRNGLFSEEERLNITFNPKSPRTCDMVESHLDWYSQTPSTFISVYADYHSARQEAYRRADDGHKGVVLWKIDTQEGDFKAQYRNARLLADKCKVRIPKRAWNNSENEWFFLYHIPKGMMVK